MNKTERLYALVEQLRAVAPRPRRAAWLAQHFEVSTRTIERDILALLQAGVPIWSTPGPGGGYAIDPAHTLGPVNFTAAEAAAIATALARPGATPFRQAGASALAKLVAVLRTDDEAQARTVLERIGLAGHLPSAGSGAEVPAVLERAVLERQVLEIDYVDRHGEPTTGRVVEPYGFLNDDRHWFLVAHCRLRRADRPFRVDRISAARLCHEQVRHEETLPAGLASVPRPTLDGHR